MVSRREVLAGGLASVLVNPWAQSSLSLLQPSSCSFNAIDSINEGTSLWNDLVVELEKLGADMIAQYQRRNACTVSAAEATRYLLRVFEGMRLFGIENADPAYPVLRRVFDTQALYGNANADALYFHASLSPEYTYRISGDRGRAHIVEVQTMSGGFIYDGQKGLRTLSDISTDRGCHVDITLSRKRHKGNWLELDDNVRFLYLRQYFYDWEEETPGDFIIERVGATYPKPAVTESDLQSRIEYMISEIPSWYRHISELTQSHYQVGSNALNFIKSPSAMEDQYYGNGHYEIASDKAIVVEFRPPECGYWSLQLLSRFWETLDFDGRQSSINGSQAYLTPEGIFFGVISPEDPGYVNWLDTAGSTRGLMSLRVLRASTPPNVSFHVVPRKNLVDIMPLNVPQMTLSERSAAVRKRMLSVTKRYRQ